MANERQYYDLIAKSFLAKELKCFDSKREIGTTMGQVDVVGIKELSSDFKSTTELVAVEVKDENAPFLNSIGQAFAYSIYAHRCYLAFKKGRGKRFTQEEVDIASQFGVGLVEIRSKRKIEVVSISKQFEPKQHYVHYFYSKLGYFSCAICNGTYAHRDITRINKKQHISPSEDNKYLGNIERVIKQHRNALYFLYTLFDQRGDQRTNVYDKRYICKDCISIFAPLLKA